MRQEGVTVAELSAIVFCNTSASSVKFYRIMKLIGII